MEKGDLFEKLSFNGEEWEAKKHTPTIVRKYIVNEGVRMYVKFRTIKKEDNWYWEYQGKTSYQGI